ncbi:hypothetical protein H5410_007518 [Solanum commersonii]|uniref:DUF4283 domain-containing protein n=1 Tax=Solanum commersonii TaxID=4109 RepID=A0A9J6ADC2_SOLCO|nr:hypothetical protein H5410_007518 [Solanum commersonii]
MKKILHQGPLFLGSQFISIRKWEPKFNPSMAQINFSTVWIRLPELPTEIYDLNILQRIGNQIGTILKIDSVTMNTTRGQYTRLCILAPLSKTLPRDILIGPLEQQEQDKNNKQRTKNDSKNQAPNSEGKKIATLTAKEIPSHPQTWKNAASPHPKKTKIPTQDSTIPMNLFFWIIPYLTNTRDSSNIGINGWIDRTRCVDTTPNPKSEEKVPDYEQWHPDGIQEAYQCLYLLICLTTTSLLFLSNFILASVIFAIVCCIHTQKNLISLIVEEVKLRGELGCSPFEGQTHLHLHRLEKSVCVRIYGSEDENRVVCITVIWDENKNI